jgi:hypothetical protein
VCERLRLALEGEGHDVFVDRVELETGHPFDAKLRDAIERCDLFIFLISPETVAPASYALAELSIAEQRWRHPAGRVLPAMVASTPKDAVPLLACGDDPRAERRCSRRDRSGRQALLALAEAAGRDAGRAPFSLCLPRLPWRATGSGGSTERRTDKRSRRWRRRNNSAHPATTRSRGSALKTL